MVHSIILYKYWLLMREIVQNNSRDDWRPWATIFPETKSREICDMIKGNESDVGNIDFELQAKRDDKFLCLHCCWI